MSDDIRNYIRLIEAASKTKPFNEVVIDHMVKCLLKGKYWDDYARQAYPNKVLDTDNDLHDMFDTFFRRLPPEVQQLSRGRAMRSEPFKALVREWATTRFQEVKTKLESQLSGPCQIHRIIKVPSKWTKQRGTVKLGLYWTYDFGGWAENGAYPIWADGGMKGIDILIEAVLAPAQIDWFHTYLANMDWYSGDREFEVRLTAGTPVAVKSIHVMEHDEPTREIDTSAMTFVA